MLLEKCCSFTKEANCASLTGILAVIHQLPAHDGVVVSAILNGHVLELSGVEFVVERFRRQEAEAIRVAGEVEIISAVARSVVTLQGIVVGTIDDEIARIEIAGGVIAFDMPFRGALFRGRGIAVRQSEIKLRDLAENQAHIIAAHTVVVRRTFLITHPNAEERIRHIVVRNTYFVAVDDDDAIHRGKLAGLPR